MGSRILGSHTGTFAHAHACIALRTAFVSVTDVWLCLACLCCARLLSCLDLDVSSVDPPAIPRRWLPLLPPIAAFPSRHAHPRRAACTLPPAVPSLPTVPSVMCAMRCITCIILPHVLCPFILPIPLPTMPFWFCVILPLILIVVLCVRSVVLGWTCCCCRSTFTLRLPAAAAPWRACPLQVACGRLCPTIPSGLPAALPVHYYTLPFCPYHCHSGSALPIPVHPLQFLFPCVHGTAGTVRAKRLRGVPHNVRAALLVIAVRLPDRAADIHTQLRHTCRREVYLYTQDAICVPFEPLGGPLDPCTLVPSCLFPVPPGPIPHPHPFVDPLLIPHHTPHLTPLPFPCPVPCPSLIPGHAGVVFVYFYPFVFIFFFFFLPNSLLLHLGCTHVCCCLSFGFTHIHTTHTPHIHHTWVHTPHRHVSPLRISTHLNTLCHTHL